MVIHLDCLWWLHPLQVGLLLYLLFASLLMHDVVLQDQDLVLNDEGLGWLRVAGSVILVFLHVP